MLHRPRCPCDAGRRRRPGRPGLKEAPSAAASGAASAAAARTAAGKAARPFGALPVEKTSPRILKSTKLRVAHSQLRWLRACLRWALLAYFAVQLRCLASLAPQRFNPAAFDASTPQDYRAPELPDRARRHASSSGPEPDRPRGNRPRRAFPWSARSRR